MSEKLKWMIRPGLKGPYWALDDITRIRREMNRLGYDACENDIEWAYSEFCEEHWAASWIEVSDTGVTRAANEVISKLVVAEQEESQ